MAANVLDSDFLLLYYRAKVISSIISNTNMFNVKEEFDQNSYHERFQQCLLRVRPSPTASATGTPIFCSQYLKTAFLIIDPTAYS